MTIEFSSMAPLLQVFDMPTSLRFYRDVLGFRTISDSGGGDESDWVWLERDGVDLMLNTAYEADARPASADPRRQQCHEDTGLFFACEALDAAYEHLKNRGVAVDPPKTAPYGMRQLYVRDPDHYVLCFQCPAESGDGVRQRQERSTTG